MPGLLLPVWPFCSCTEPPQRSICSCNSALRIWPPAQSVFAFTPWIQPSSDCTAWPASRISSLVFEVQSTLLHSTVCTSVRVAHSSVSVNRAVAFAVRTSGSVAPAPGFGDPTDDTAVNSPSPGRVSQDTFSSCGWCIFRFDIEHSWTPPPDQRSRFLDTQRELLYLDCIFPRFFRDFHLVQWRHWEGGAYGVSPRTLCTDTEPNHGISRSSSAITES